MGGESTACPMATRIIQDSEPERRPWQVRGSFDNIRKILSSSSSALSTKPSWTLGAALGHSLNSVLHSTFPLFPDTGRACTSFLSLSFFGHLVLHCPGMLDVFSHICSASLWISARKRDIHLHSFRTAIGLFRVIASEYLQCDWPTIQWIILTEFTCVLWRRHANVKN